MRRKVILMLAVGLVIVLLLYSLPLLASRGKWMYLASEDYQLLALVDNVPVIFNALQDKDKQKISEAVSGTFMENGVEVLDNSNSLGAIENLEGVRPDIAPPLQVKKIKPDNTLDDAEKEVFEISYQIEGKTKKAKFANLYLDGKSIIVPADPEFLSQELIPSPDSTKYVLATEKGLWLIPSGKQKATKISKDEYNGKTYNELSYELQKKLAGDEGPAVLWWNSNPIFSPDSSKVVYMTNRDCIKSGGSSLWLYDLATGEERPLVKNAGGEHYRCKGWVDDKNIIYKKYNQVGDLYFLTDVNGNSKELELEGKQPDILAVYGEMIAYTPDCFNPRVLRVVNVDLQSELGRVDVIYEKSIDGALRQIIPNVFTIARGNFSPDGLKLAYLYAPNSDETIQYISIVDLKTKEEVILKDVPSKDAVRTVFYNFDWIDNERMLIRLSRIVDGMNEIHSWIYTGGR